MDEHEAGGDRATPLRYLNSYLSPGEEEVASSSKELNKTVTQVIFPSAKSRGTPAQSFTRRKTLAPCFTIGSRISQSSLQAIVGPRRKARAIIASNHIFCVE